MGFILDFSHVLIDTIVAFAFWVLIFIIIDSTPIE